MIVGLLFSLFMYLMGGVVGYIFGDYRWGIAFMVLFPAYIVFGYWYGNWKDKRKDEDDRINQRGKYSPEEVARRKRKDELMIELEEYEKKREECPIGEMAYWFDKWIETTKKLRELGYEFSGDILIDKRELELNKNK